MKRTKPPSRKAPMKRTPMKRGHQPHRARVQNRDRWREPPAGPCVRCGYNWGWDRHHVVFAQHVAAHGGDTSDPDNQIQLCRQCHDLLHATRKFPSRLLPDRAVNFTLRLLGPGGAYEYLTRYYDGTGDDRVGWLLEQWEAGR